MSLTKARERVTSACGCPRVSVSVQRYSVQYKGYNLIGVITVEGGTTRDTTQEAKYVEHWPNMTSAWAGWSRFDIPVDRYGGVHSQLICTSSPLGFPTCHQASQQENTYCTKYQKADRASTLVTLWVRQHWFIFSYIAAYIQMQYRVGGVHSTGLTVARGVRRCPLLTFFDGYLP
jgi:hypothetical protein